MLVTRDEDLLAIAEQCQRGGRRFADVVYAHQLRFTIGKCISDLESIAKAYEPVDMAKPASGVRKAVMFTVQS